MTTYQAVVNTASNVDVSAQDENGDYIEGNNVVGILNNFRTHWPENKCPDGGTMMPGTRVASGRKLNYVTMDIESEDPLALLQIFVALEGKDWTVVALGFLWEKDTTEIDEETGEPVDVPDDLIPDFATIEPFLPDVVVGGTPESPVMGRPTAPVTLTTIAGRRALTV